MIDFNDKEKLGSMIVDILMQLDKLSAEKAEKEALTFTQKMMKRVNSEIQSGLKRGFTTAIGGIFGGDAGMLVGAMMGGGAGAALGVAAGYAIDYAVKQVMKRYKSEDFFKNIDPYIQQDYSNVTSVKSNLNTSTKDAFILSEVAQILKTDPDRLSRQIAMSEQFKGFSDLQGGTSTEKLLNFLTSMSGMTPLEQIKRAKQYGITAGNIPSLKLGIGNVDNTLLSGFNKEELDRYIEVLEGYSASEKAKKATQKELALKARKELDADVLFGETGTYANKAEQDMKNAERNLNKGLSQQNVSELVTAVNEAKSTWDEILGTIGLLYQAYKDVNSGTHKYQIDNK